MDNQFIPLVQGILDRPAEQALGRWMIGIRPGLELLQYRLGLFLSQFADLLVKQVFVSRIELHFYDRTARFSAAVPSLADSRISAAEKR